jgi:hypothetical protein
MKKVLMILGAVFGVILISIAIAVGYAAYNGKGLDEESKRYVDAAVPAIVKNWDMTEMLSRTSPEFNKATKTEDLEKLWIMFRKLGAMKIYKGSKGESNQMINLPQGTTITAKYSADVEFENGPAQILITIIKRGDDWQILGFKVNSSAILPDR